MRSIVLFATLLALAPTPAIASIMPPVDMGEARVTASAGYALVDGSVDLRLWGPWSVGAFAQRAGWFGGGWDSYGARTGLGFANVVPGVALGVTLSGGWSNYLQGMDPSGPHTEKKAWLMPAATAAAGPALGLTARVSVGPVFEVVTESAGLAPAVGTQGFYWMPNAEVAWSSDPARCWELVIGGGTLVGLRGRL